MSGLLALTHPKDVFTGQRAYVGEPGEFFGIIAESFKSSRLNFNANSSVAAAREVYAEREKLYEDITGESINSVWTGKIDSARGQGSQASRIKKKLIDEKISSLRNIDPVTFGPLLTSEEVEAEARKRATDALAEFEDTFEYSPGVGKYVGQLAGAVGASFIDPVQLTVGAVTAAASIAVPGIGYGATILRQAALDAGQSALVEAAIQPEIAQWQRDLGREYGLADSLVQIAAAGATGALISFPIGAASRLSRNLDAAQLMERLSQAEGVRDTVRVAFSEIASAMRVRESAPSPDLARHAENVSAVNKAASEDRPISTREISTRINDDIDGLPSEAFDFLDPERSYQITTTFTAEGVEPIVRVKELKIKELTTDQLKSLIKKRLLPKITRELREDIEAHRKNSLNAVNVKRNIKTVEGQVKVRRKQFSDAKREAINIREERIKAADERAAAYKRDSKGSAAKREAKASELRKSLRAQAEDGYRTAIRNAERNFAEEKIKLDQKIRKFESLLDQELYNNERIVALKELEQGLIPTGDDYTSRSIRRTFDKILDASLERKKFFLDGVKKPEILERLSDMGVIKRPLEPVSTIESRLKDTESQFDELIHVAKSELNDADPNTRIIDAEGNETTLGKILDIADDEAELTAVRTCATGIE